MTGGGTNDTGVYLPLMQRSWKDSSTLAYTGPVGRRPEKGATAKLVWGCKVLASTTPPNKFGGGTHIFPLLADLAGTTGLV